MDGARFRDNTPRLEPKYPTNNNYPMVQRVSTPSLHPFANRTAVSYKYAIIARYNRKISPGVPVSFGRDRTRITRTIFPFSCSLSFQPIFACLDFL